MNSFIDVNKILKSTDKEKLLNQKGIVIWLTGLSGSGKSTLAKLFENYLYEKGHITQLLDGDSLRSCLNHDLTFSMEDRKENIRRAAEVAKLFASSGIVTICSFISPTEEIRTMAKEIIGAARYYEIFINCPLKICEKRDVKGLYAKVRSGEIKNFTGIDAPFEIPKNPNLVLKTDVNDLESCLQKMVDNIYHRV